MTDPNKKTPSENKIVYFSSSIPAVGVPVPKEIQQKKRKLSDDQTKITKKHKTFSIEDIIAYTLAQKQGGLDLGSKQLTALPESISTLTNLERLYLNYNRLSVFPNSISTLTNLVELHLNSNQLTRLPKPISTLTKLERLFANHNELSNLTKAISTLTNLKELNLNCNKLTTLPESISTLTNLTILNLTKNYLLTLPESISNLVNLNFWYLDDNQFTRLPSSVSKLGNLRELCVDDNILQSLRPLISTLPKLILWSKEPRKLLFNVDNPLPNYSKKKRIVPISLREHKSDVQVNDISEHVEQQSNQMELDTIFLDSYGSDVDIEQMDVYMAQKNALDIECLQLKKKKLQLQNKYLQMKITNFSGAGKQSQIAKELAIKDESRKPKLEVKRPLNSTKLIAVSTEYTRNQDYYNANKYNFLDGYWYLIYKQNIVIYDLDKKKVIQELVKLKSDECLLTQKGQEKKIYKVNDITDKDIENIYIMDYDKTSINGKWNFIVDAGSQITCLSSSIINTFRSLFPKLDEISIDTTYETKDRFKYGCHLIIDGNVIEVEVVPWSQCILGYDVLRYFRIERDGGRTVSLRYHPEIALDDDVQFTTIDETSIFPLDNNDISIWKSEDMKPNNQTLITIETKKLDPLQVSNIASHCSRLKTREDVESYIQGFQDKHPKNREILEGIKIARICYIDNDFTNANITKLRKDEFDTISIVKDDKLAGMSLIVDMMEYMKDRK